MLRAIASALATVAFIFATACSEVPHRNDPVAPASQADARAPVSPALVDQRIGPASDGGVTGDGTRSPSADVRVAADSTRPTPTIDARVKQPDSQPNTKPTNDEFAALRDLCVQLINGYRFDRTLASSPA
jgi:hypothetical protein